MQRRFCIEEGTKEQKNTYVQFRQWLVITYEGDVTEDDKREAIERVDGILMENHDNLDDDTDATE